MAPRLPRLNTRHVAVACVIAALGAVVRVLPARSQSLWYDEAITMRVTGGSFHDLTHGVRSLESTPPLYYALGWVWHFIAGEGDLASRSPSILFGLVTIALVALLAQRIAPASSAWAWGASLAAASPFLVWYAQEARAYALTAMLATASTLLLLRWLEPGGRGDAAGWSITAALLMATHWFAAFIVIAQAIWVIRDRARPLVGRALAIAPPVLAGLALAPLALAQMHGNRATWIDDTPLHTRTLLIAKQFAAGPGTPHGWLIAGVVTVCCLALVALAIIASRQGRQPARPLIVCGTVAGAALVVPIVCALAGKDFVLARNVIGALPLVLALCAAGATSRRIGGAIAALAVALMALATVQTIREPNLHRPDWKGAASLIVDHRGDGHAAGDVVVLVTPTLQAEPLRRYLPPQPRMVGGDDQVQRAPVWIVASNASGRVPAIARSLRAARGGTVRTFHLGQVTAFEIVALPPVRGTFEWPATRARTLAKLGPNMVRILRVPLR